MIYIILIILIVIFILLLKPFPKSRKWVGALVIMISLCVLIVAIMKSEYIFIPFIAAFLVLFSYLFIKSFKKKSLIELLEVDANDPTVNYIMENYKKEIYNYFPFYEAGADDKYYLLMKSSEAVGFIIAGIYKDELTIKIDYIMSGNNNFEMMNYIYNKNPGYFKRIGINKLFAHSFHKKRTLDLRKLGFKKNYFNGQPIFIKSLD